MTAPAERPDVARILEGLKPFQRDTVDYVFRRMYSDPEPTRRFLVADEVGLGKTLVARGLIARTIDHLWESVERIDIVYICSNADIARQNVRRLNVSSREDFNLASRITLLPVRIHDLRGNRLNFVSFTPGTSFDLKSSMGTRSERSLLYLLLRKHWGLEGRKPLRIFQGSVRSTEYFEEHTEWFRDEYEIDEELWSAFLETLDAAERGAVAEGRPTTRSRFDSLLDRAWRYSARSNMPAELQQEQSALVGELRDLLARSCLRALQPDFIILDEFQRFKHLLGTDNEAGLLARQLFEYSDATAAARVLLLSATPYKMYTLYDEAADDDHYKDFLQTLDFLEDGSSSDGGFGPVLEAYRRGLFRMAEGDEAGLRAAKERLEGRLRRVMVRTERLAVTGDRSGMLREVPSTAATLSAVDVRGYRTLQSVSDRLEEGDILEYWKSSPYLLNFMDDYALKRAFRDEVQGPGMGKGLAPHLVRDPAVLLSRKDVRAYRLVDPGNARLRDLAAATVDNGAWRLLWVPPSLPYYAPAGAYADPGLQGFTKRLVFSSWQVVPKVIATLLSYDAERRIANAFDPSLRNTPDARKARAQLLRFVKTSEGRMTGMPVLGLLYPSFVLARLGDPLEAARPGPDAIPPTALLPLEEILERVRRRIAERLPAITGRHSPNPVQSEAWYWAAPILLDAAEDPDATLEWLGRRGLAADWAGEEDRPDLADGAWKAHVKSARDFMEMAHVYLGPPPPDLDRVLARMAIAGPAVCALRALARMGGPEASLSHPEVRIHAGRVAWALRSLFNGVEATALLRTGATEEPYWLRVLAYAAEGNLQAVLDEYLHLLRESEGLQDARGPEATEALARAVAEALSLQAASLGVDDIRLTRDGARVTVKGRKMRSHFALRFGEFKSDDGISTRPDQVRRAFNSPFWPFVLATTSVGQEGLDFHSYCHAVVHWNLPANPVDMEQREGRVHRFKGHAVRKNVARRHGAGAPAGGNGDVWGSLFADARAAEPDATGLVPFWIYPVAGGAHIERHVPSLPLSRDRHRLDALRRSLAIYRMVFGQPRQEDLLAFLLERVGAERLQALGSLLRVDLLPTRAAAGPYSPSPK